MALLGRDVKQASPTDLNRLNVRGGGDAVLETLYVRQVSTATATPTTSTPYAVPLTTTFIPPDSCNEEHLTMLSSPGYFIWLNEPVPVSGTTVSDCYPPEFLSYYTTYHVNPTVVGSRVPLMSPLICPFGWDVVSETGDYRACCPTGYGLAAPTPLIDPNRPAYGGTCYKEWPLSSSTFVEVYDSLSASGTMLVTATTTHFQNYAHVIDGIAVSTLSPTSSSSGSSSSQTSAQSGGSGHTSLSPGAIAGIVIGVVAGVGLLAVGIYLFARRHRQRQQQQVANQTPLPPPPPPKDGAASTTVGSPDLTSHPSEVMSMQTGYSEMAAESHIHELDSGRPAEKP